MITQSRELPAGGDTGLASRSFDSARSPGGIERLAPGSRASTGLQGHLDLEAAPRPDGRTILSRQAFRAPFHVGKPYWDGRVLQVQVVNPTAGILSGDRLDLRVRVAGGAVLRLTTPAATRVFTMPNGLAECRQSFVVEAGGWLECAPEPLCPHGGAHYSQTTRLDVAESGEVYWVEMLAPGRAGRDELWAWRRLRLRWDVTWGGRPVLRERLDAGGAGLARASSFFGAPRGWLATVLVVSPRLGADAPIWERVRALHGGSRQLGVTRLPAGGFIVRVVAPDGQALRDLLAALRGLLAGTLPLLRCDLRTPGSPPVRLI